MQIIIDIPENPTNCDVIKALFPYINVKDTNTIYYSVNIEDLQEDEEFNTVGFRKNWMDAPWKGVKQESNTKNNLGVNCISRAKAIEEADKLCLETGYDNEKVVEMLRDLPPIILQDKDAISRQAVRMAIFDECVGDKLDIDFAKVLLLQRAIKALPPIYAESEDKEWQ